MKINAYKAMHYWKDKKDATWDKSSKFDQKLFNEFKNTYESLKYKKPPYEKIGEKYLFLFYHTSKDKFGRDITELSAFFVPYEINEPKNLYDAIDKQIKDKFDSKLEYHIEFKDLPKLKKNSSSFKLIFGIVAIVAILLLYSLYPPSYQTEAKDNPPPKIESYDDFVKIWNAGIESVEDGCKDKEIGINWNKYRIENNITNIQNKFKSLLSFEEKKIDKSGLKDDEYDIAKVFDKWQNARNETKGKYQKIPNRIRERELYKVIADGLIESPFTSKTIEKLVKLNEFCYFFDQNKDDGSKISIEECNAFEKKYLSEKGTKK